MSPVLDLIQALVGALQVLFGVLAIIALCSGSAEKKKSEYTLLGTLALTLFLGGVFLLLA